MKSKAVITLIAATNATKIESKADSENIFEDSFDVLGDAGWWLIDNVLVNVPNTGVAVWDYVSKADGFTDDALYLRDNIDTDLLSAGEYVFTSGDIFTDSWEWMTDKQGQNWVALGKNWLDVSVELLTLDAEGAWRKFFDKGNYQHKEEETIWDRYDKYVEWASDEQRWEEEVEKATAKKAEVCANYTPKVG